jgi:hypothetical protein
MGPVAPIGRDVDPAANELLEEGGSRRVAGADEDDRLAHRIVERDHSVVVGKWHLGGVEPSPTKGIAIAGRIRGDRPVCRQVSERVARPADFVVEPQDHRNPPAVKRLVNGRIDQVPFDHEHSVRPGRRDGLSHSA